jgi:hypothetical protein
MGLRAVRLELAGFAHDVDVPDDLEAEPMPSEQALMLAEEDDLPALLARAESQTLLGFGRRVGYSRKVFIPLTKACRDVCHYCTFAAPLPKGAQIYLRPAEVLAIAEQGKAAGCDEALFTLGDQPELRYAAARAELAALGFATTLEYLAHCAALVLERTGLLPHLNPGVMSRDDLLRLRTVSASMGIMLESAAERLCERGGPHHRSPDKRPAVRLATLRAAGEAGVPFTTGLLIGIGETRQRAYRGATRDSRAARAIRPYPRNHRTKFSRQTRYPDGAACRAVAGGIAMDHRRDAFDFRRHHVYSSAAEPRARVRSPSCCVPASTTGAVCRR